MKIIVKNHKTCSGTNITSLILPSCIEKDKLPQLEQEGFVSNSFYASKNILKLTKGDITLTGTFVSKKIEVFFKTDIDDNKRDNVIQDIINILNKILS